MVDAGGIFLNYAFLSYGVSDMFAAGLICRVNGMRLSCLAIKRWCAGNSNSWRACKQPESSVNTDAGLI